MERWRPLPAAAGCSSCKPSAPAMAAGLHARPTAIQRHKPRQLPPTSNYPVHHTATRTWRQGLNSGRTWSAGSETLMHPSTSRPRWSCPTLFTVPTAGRGTGGEEGGGSISPVPAPAGPGGCAPPGSRCPLQAGRAALVAGSGRARTRARLDVAWPQLSSQASVNHHSPPLQRETHPGACRCGGGRARRPPAPPGGRRGSRGG